MSERETVKCPRCGEAEPHFVPPSFGEEGFFICERPLAPPVSRAAGGETLADLYGSVPDLIPNPMTSEAWVRRYRDGYDAGYEAALSSAPAPEERHRRFAEAVNARISYDVQDSTVYVEFKSPRDAVAFEEAMRGCDRHPDPDFRPASSSPSGAGSPVAHRWERCSECGPMVICGHCGNNCCNGGSGDNCPDRCASAYAEQKAGWARLNASKAWHPAPPAAGREPSELLDAARALVERIDLIHANDDYRGVWSLAFAHGHRYAGPTYEAELARLRAALGASAQTNTGEGR